MDGTVSRASIIMISFLGNSGCMGGERIVALTILRRVHFGFGFSDPEFSQADRNKTEVYCFFMPLIG